MITKEEMTSMKMLIANIIRMAVKDWATTPENTVKTNCKTTISRDEIRQFFKEEMWQDEKWAEILCDAICVRADKLLEKLESKQYNQALGEKEIDYEYDPCDYCNLPCCANCPHSTEDDDV